MTFEFSSHLLLPLRFSLKINVNAASPLSNFKSELIQQHCAVVGIIYAHVRITHWPSGTGTRYSLYTLQMQTDRFTEFMPYNKGHFRSRSTIACWTL